MIRSVQPETIAPVPRSPRGPGKRASIEDAYIERAPKQMQMADLRALAATSKVSGRKEIDIEKLPFGVELELEGFDFDEAEPFFDDLDSWNVNRAGRTWKLDHDGSLDDGGEAVSPVMTLENGKAEKQIRKVLEHLRSLGGKATKHCGLHIHVDASCLGKKGLQTLMKIGLDQERLLFRLAQNGNKTHRGISGENRDDPYYYCKPYAERIEDPFPMLHAQGPNHFRNAFYESLPEEDGGRDDLPDPSSDEPFEAERRGAARYFGLNFNSYWYRGTVEFRLFDATHDPDQVMTSIKLALNMMKAAAEGDYAYLQPQPLSKGAIPRESYEYFMSRVVADDKLRKRLDRVFEESGGKLRDDEPVRDKRVITVAQMLSKGFSFTSEGRGMNSPFEIAARMDGNEVEVKTPAGPFKVSSLEAFDALSQRLSKENAERIREAVSRLETQGWGVDAGKENLHEALWAGNCRLRPSTAPAGEGFAVKDPDFVVDFSRLSGRRQNLLADMAQVMANGGSFIRAGKRKPASLARLLDTIGGGVTDLNLRLSPQSPQVRLRDIETAEAAINVALGRHDRLSASNRAVLERAAALRLQGIGMEGDEAPLGDAELLATLLSGDPVTLVDPIGGATEVRQVDDFTRTADAHLDVTRMLGADEQATLHGLQTLVDVGRVVLQGTAHQPVEAAHVPWLFARQQPLRVSGAVEASEYPAAAHGVQAADWDAARRIVEQERGEGTAAALLSRMQTLRERGASFSYVVRARQGWSLPKSVPMTLNSAFVDRLGAEGVRVRLPGWRWWKGWPRRNVVIKGEEDLRRLVG